jgi:hypothetical protein
MKNTFYTTEELITLCFTDKHKLEDKIENLRNKALSALTKILDDKEDTSELEANNLIVDEYQLLLEIYKAQKIFLENKLNNG